MRKQVYFQVYEYSSDPAIEKRRIYTFGNANAAHDMVEFIVRSDECSPNVGVEEYEAPADI